MPPFFHPLESIPFQNVLPLRALLSSTPHFPRRLLASPSVHPTKTIRSIKPFARSLVSVLNRRQVNPSIIPSTYSGIDSGPSPGTVVGIVFGTVGGFLLLLWLLYTCFNLGGTSGAFYEEEIIRRRSRSPRRQPSSRSRSEVIEVQRQRSPRRDPSPRREPRRETIIIEETRRPALEREDDIIEVIEEHSPVRRSRRGSGRESGGAGSYRIVDPDAFGGGSRPPRKVGRGR